MLSVSECIKDIKQTEHQGCKLRTPGTQTSRTCCGYWGHRQAGRAEDAGDTDTQDVLGGGGGERVTGQGVQSGVG